MSAPSVTLIVMSAVSPTSASVGVPVSAPVSALNVAHVGLFSIVNSRKSSSASDACGVKEYGLPASTPGSGVPVISGAALTGGVIAGSAQAAPLAQPTAALHIQAHEVTGLELVQQRDRRSYRTYRENRSYGYRRRGYDGYAYSPRQVERPFGWSRSVTGRWHYHGQY